MKERQPVETRLAGLEPLAVLPLFLKLDGRRVVLAGDHPGGPWKGRLLAAAGARVRVLAPAAGDEWREVAATAPAGEIALHHRGWEPADLEGAAFAVAAFEDEAEARRFVAHARACGVLVNAIDRPDLCDVQFGAVVNRSPLVIGISTDGAVPVLAQAIRSAVEGLLPRGIGAWVAAARRWRERVRTAAGGFAERRRAWERFAARALAEPERPPDESDLAAILADSGPAGSVTLVGAGPGNPELLTLRAVRALRTADVILYDDLVAPEILDFARREAKTMLVGKTGHAPSCRQDEIGALMVRLAGEGRRVVRLKGGDPLVFGRANEEIAACERAAIPITVVPGITAAVAAAARLTTSLTDRAAARRLQFVTGHDHKGDLPADLDWAALADPEATTAIYMGRRTVRRIMERLLAKGLPGTTPAVAMSHVSRPGERRCAATVATIADALDAAGLDGPMVILLGAAIGRRLAPQSSAARSAGSSPRSAMAR